MKDLPPGVRLPAITRPNGKAYRPRKIEAYPIGEDGDVEEVAVLGTHDVACATGYADDLVRHYVDSGYTVRYERLVWWRSTWGSCPDVTRCSRCGRAIDLDDVCDHGMARDYCPDCRPTIGP